MLSEALANEQFTLSAPNRHSLSKLRLALRPFADFLRDLCDQRLLPQSSQRKCRKDAKGGGSLQQIHDPIRTAIVLPDTVLKAEETVSDVEPV